MCKTIEERKIKNLNRSCADIECNECPICRICNTIANGFDRNKKTKDVVEDLKEALKEFDDKYAKIQSWR